MKTPTDYECITREKLRHHKNIKHDIVQYVDDSNNSIGANTVKEIKDYTEYYFSLLKVYYKTNRMKLNNDKTIFMIVCNQYVTNKSLEVKLRLNEHEEIENDLAMNILGWWTTPDGSLTYHLTKIKGIVSKK